MKKIVVVFFVATILLFGGGKKVAAADVWLGETSGGVYWAMGETFVHLYDSEGYSYEYFDIDFKIVSRQGYVTIHHCQMWVDGSYRIDGGEMQKPKKSPHPMENLRHYGFSRADRGE